MNNNKQANNNFRKKNKQENEKKQKKNKINYVSQINEILSQDTEYRNLHTYFYIVSLLFFLTIRIFFIFFFVLTIQYERTKLEHNENITKITGD